MERIEIRQNKKKLIPMLALLTAILFGMTYLIYFSGRFENNNTIKIVYIFLSASLVYSIYMPARKLYRNDPVLSLSKTDIEINETGKSIILLWSEISHWQIEKEKEGNTYYLLLKTGTRARRINISWLEKNHNELEEILQTYKPI